MSNLKTKIENLLLSGPLDAICGASVVYLAMDGNNVGSYEDVRNLANSAVDSVLEKIVDNDRKEQVSKVMPEIQQMSMEVTAEGWGGDDLEERYLWGRLEMSKIPMTKSDVSLYDALKKNLEKYIEPSKLLWNEQLANTIVGDDSILVEKLNPRQKRIFMEPYENMKCTLPESLDSICDRFVNDFNRKNNANVCRNIKHDKTWKEDIPALERRTKRTYIADVVMPLLRASLEDMPDGNICLSSADRQSLASKFRRNLSEVSKEQMGKKPNVMALVKYGGKINELAYTECSRVICNDTKKMDDEIKLWREALDGINFVNLACRPLSNQFGIAGIQVAGEVIYLNVLVNDAGGLSRYFHIDHAEIPLVPKSSRRVKPLVRLSLNWRNILIVNKNLLMRALDQASSNPPRNVPRSPT
ncbi:24294_t:CDS:2, partial [Racocetra persica]